MTKETKESMKAEMQKLETELNTIIGDTNVLSQPAKQQVKNLLGKITDRKLLPNYTIPVKEGVKEITISDILTYTLKESENVNDADSEKITLLKKQVIAYKVILGE